MSLSAMIRKRQSGNFATASPATFATQDGEKVRPVAGVASVAVANPTLPKGDKGKPCSRWLFHFAERDDLPVTFAPAVDHAAALACYPNAVAAEPIPDRPQRQLIKAEADEIAALVQAIYANDTADDRAEAFTAALADPDGALLCYRTLAKYRGIAIAAPDVGRPKASWCCHHFTSPDKLDGYFSRRGDLALACGGNFIFWGNAQTTVALPVTDMQ